MRSLLDKDFLLETETAVQLYEKNAKCCPIIDFHNHLNPREIYEDRRYDNLSQAWLGGDHYKWRAMRAWGVPEEQVTGTAGDYEKFLAWADTVSHAIGNPLYHWTHLELMRYFGIFRPLSAASAGEIWQEANEKLKSPQSSAPDTMAFCCRSWEKSMRNADWLCSFISALCEIIPPGSCISWDRTPEATGWRILTMRPSFPPCWIPWTGRTSFQGLCCII